MIKTATFVALACLGLAACTQSEPGATPVTQSVQPVTPPANSGITIPGHAAATHSAGPNQPPAGGPGLKVAPSNAGSTGSNMPSTPATNGGAAYTRPPLTQSQ